MMTTVITFVFQVTLVVMVITEILKDPDYIQVLISIDPPHIVFCRFVCATILHITLIDEML